jgi:hypothetical protein
MQDTTSDPGLREDIEYAVAACNTILTSMDLLQLRGTVTDPQLSALTLHATIFELLSACVVLAETSRDAGIPILLRSMYESLVDLDNLVRQPGYHAHMEAANLRQVARAIGSSGRGVAVDRTRGGAKVARAALLEELVALKERGKMPLSLDERCALAGRTEEYEGLYADLCLDAHNNIAALTERHVRAVGTDAHLEISVLGDPDVAAVARHLSMGVGFLIESALLIHGHFGASTPALADLKRTHDQKSQAAVQKLERD